MRRRGGVALAIVGLLAAAPTFGQGADADPKPAQPGPEPKPGAEPQPTAKPEPKPGAEPQPTAEPEPKPGAEPQPTAEPEPEPKPGAEPQPTAEPQPKPGAEPEPEGDKGEGAPGQGSAGGGPKTDVFAGRGRALTPPGPVEKLAARLQTSCVRVYGAGGFVGIPSYGVGVVVDGRGFVLTTWSIALDTPELHVVTPDGKRCPALVWRADVGLGAALLKIDALDSQLQPLRLGDSRRLSAGSQVIALGNPFRVAYGYESLAVMRGVVSGVVSPRQGGFRVLRLPPRLERVILTDIPNNPGTQGGLLATLEGELVGILGRLIESRATNTILNVAIPADELRGFVKAGLAQAKAEPVAKAPPSEEGRRHPPELGLRLQRASLVRSPLAYVEAVRRGSPAARAGLRADDLVFRVGPRTIRSCRDFDEALAALEPGSKVRVVVKRGEECLSLELALPQEEQE